MDKSRSYVDFNTFLSALDNHDVVYISCSAVGCGVRIRMQDYSVNIETDPKVKSELCDITDGSGIDTPNRFSFWPDSIKNVLREAVPVAGVSESEIYHVEIYAAKGLMEDLISIKFTFPCVIGVDVDAIQMLADSAGLNP